MCFFSVEPYIHSDFNWVYNAASLLCPMLLPTEHEAGGVMAIFKDFSRPFI